MSAVTQSPEPQCTLVSSLEKKKKRVELKPYFAEFVHDLHSAKDNYIDFTYTQLFNMCLSCISLTSHAKNAFHAMPEMCQNSLL